MIIKWEFRCKNRDAKTTAIIKKDGERNIMTELKKVKKSELKTADAKKVSAPKKNPKVDDSEVEDEKKLLKEAEQREKESKIKEAKEKKHKKIEIKVEKKEKQDKEVVKRTKKRSKKYKDSKEKIEKDKMYEIDQAIELIKSLPKTKFDSTIELHLKIDKKVENLRGVVNLPAGVPKPKKVLEIDEKNVEEAIGKIKSGKIEFDIIVASPSVMPKMAVLAKILGPKGKMPNPKNGTISENVKEVAEDFRAGKIEFKADKGNNLHFAFAKISYSDEKIKENIEAVLSAVPIGKILSAHINATMGPSVKIEIKKRV